MLILFNLFTIIVNLADYVGVISPEGDQAPGMIASWHPKVSPCQGNSWQNDQGYPSVETKVKLES